MSKQITCEHIRESLEEQLFGRSVPDSDRVKQHLESCESCRSYVTALEKLNEVSGVEHTLPGYEQVRFSARVRTRIEEKKAARSKRTIFARPAFQIAAMLIIIVSVVFYMSNTEPEPVFVLDEIEHELIDSYTFYYDEMELVDADLIADLYNDYLFGDGELNYDVLFPVYFDTDFYYDINQLTPEEIDYIIQRLEEV